MKIEKPANCSMIPSKFKLIDPNKSPEENCLNCLDKSVDDSNDLEINTVQV
jgi:hypothetical protein